ERSAACAGPAAASPNRVIAGTSASRPFVISRFVFFLLILTSRPALDASPPLGLDAQTLFKVQSCDPSEPSKRRLMSTYPAPIWLPGGAKLCLRRGHVVTKPWSKSQMITIA